MRYGLFQALPLSYVVDGSFAASINSYVKGLYDIPMIASANLLVEALKLTHGLLVLPYSQLSLNGDDVRDTIEFICTVSYFFFLCTLYAL
jgi:hypothetical protein